MAHGGVKSGAMIQRLKSEESVVESQITCIITKIINSAAKTIEISLPSPSFSRRGVQSFMRGSGDGGVVLKYSRDPRGKIGCANEESFEPHGN